MSSDLLSYSIMMNGEKAVSYAAPHYAPLAVGKPEKITLPPISAYVGLTERNLNSLNLLTSSVSSPPLLTSLLALELPLLLPRMAAHDLYKLSYGNRNVSVSSTTTSDRVSSESGATTPSIASAAVAPASSESPKKRRQRLGPSCDNCRARKVKCNAEVMMLSRHFAQNECDSESYAEEFASLLPEHKLTILSGELVTVGDYTLVLSNNKLIKYKSCLSCAGKALGCCFSKGFTKEDIVYSKRSGPEAVPLVVERKAAAVKVVKKRSAESSGSTRKSSCTACRKRKVKCVMHTRLNKCIGCMKKDSTCSFEV